MEIDKVEGFKKS